MATKKAPAKKVAVKKPAGAGLDVPATPIAATDTAIGSVPVASNVDAGGVMAVYTPPTDGKFAPITVEEVVDKLPSSADSAVPADVITAIIATKGDKWAKVSLGGRKVSTVRNNLNRALENKGYGIKTRAIGDALYVTLK